MCRLFCYVIIIISIVNHILGLINFVNFELSILEPVADPGVVRLVRSNPPNSLHEDPGVRPILIPAARPRTFYVINMHL